MAITYNNLYLDIRRKLVAAGSMSATMEAQELVCFGSDKTREELRRDGRLYVPPETEQRIWDLVNRHNAGEPVAYIIGEWEFYGVPLDITPDVLVPRPDTEILAQAAIQYLREFNRCHVLDLCAGSGCVGLAIASQVPQANIILGEVSDAALKISRQNIRRNNLSGRVISMRMNALERPDHSLGEFSCVVCNPPYIPTDDIQTLDASVQNYEPHIALDGGKDGLDFYRSITEKWREVIEPAGELFFEVGINQAEDVRAIMRKNGFGDIKVIRDLHDIPRVLAGTRYSDI